MRVEYDVCDVCASRGLINTAGVQCDRCGGPYLCEKHMMIYMNRYGRHEFLCPKCFMKITRRCLGRVGPDNTIIADDKLWLNEGDKVEVIVWRMPNDI